MREYFIYVSSDGGETKKLLATTEVMDREDLSTCQDTIADAITNDYDSFEDYEEE